MAANNITGDSELSFFPMSEGRVLSTGSTYDYHYFLKDHLGNVRVVFSGNDGEVKERNFYYPFGITTKLGTIIGDENKIKYNSKELEDDHNLNWYHYGARYYDPTLGRWHTMDPADEFNSPYLYVGNNPVMFIDPDGMETDDYMLSKTGQIDLLSKTPLPYDVLYNSDMSDKIIIFDQNILKDLRKVHDNPIIRYAYSNRLLDVAKLFVFAANYTVLEWSMIGIHNQEQFSYFIGHRNSIWRTGSWKNLAPIKKVFFNIHSHPSTTSDIPEPSPGDMDNFKTFERPIRFHHVYSNLNHTLYKYNGNKWYETNQINNGIDLIKGLLK